MRAAVIEQYGGPDVVRVKEVPQPTPRRGDVVVRVHAAAVTSADARLRSARFPAGFAPFARLIFGIRRPRRPILGSAFSGVVEAVGAAVTEFAPGDEVSGMAGLRMGAHAEYLTVAAKRITRKPPAVSHDEAAGVLFGGSAALHFLRDKATIGPGTSVLINGASGAIGTIAVQLAAHAGAHVTGISSAANVELVMKLGADAVIDYTSVDVASVTDRFDVVLDTVGNLSIDGGRRLLTEGGTLLLAVATLAENLRARGNVVAGTAPERAEHFAHLLQLVSDGHLSVVIDDIYDLDDIADAHRRIDTGRKVGNLLVHPG